MKPRLRPIWSGRRVRNGSSAQSDADNDDSRTHRPTPIDSRNRPHGHSAQALGMRWEYKLLPADRCEVKVPYVIALAVVTSERSESAECLT